MRARPASQICPPDPLVGGKGGGKGDDMIGGEGGGKSDDVLGLSVI